MKATVSLNRILLLMCLAWQAAPAVANVDGFQKWRLPDKVPAPANNQTTPARVDLGKTLFFDKRLSGQKNISCATCHDPRKGWADGLPTAVGKDGKVLGRASPPITNAAFNSIQMWDGRKASLEDQASGPMDSKDEMDRDIEALAIELAKIAEYRAGFEAAYPGEGINKSTITRAIASFERTVVCRNTAFDRWLAGEASAMSKDQVAGFKVFLDPEKGNCATCHSEPNFTDDGFHNIGLKSFGDDNPDMGRFKQRPVKLMRGAFKTPSLRNVARTAPYFHDGSAKTLVEVIKHYERGGDNKSNLSPDMKELKLSGSERSNLVEFLNALNCNMQQVSLPDIPK